MAGVSPDFLTRVFQKVDKDRSGAISAQELQGALSNGTWEPFSSSTVHILLSMFDQNKSGTINFQEFGALWKYISDWQNVFKNFDRDNSGAIDTSELKSALTSFGYRLSDETFRLISQRFSKKNESCIRFDDFIHCCVMMHNVTESFKKYDTDMDGVVTLHYEQFVQLMFSTQV
ncbi:programmed cell death protein 6-like [Artemia franciscana]|uniref:EF-hand domain-containing protein n=1 Tax=Artemia franciscana TaxID=6661 RepID=A0AA88I133_ARTSF|nr:hypothetical protein QYM36_002472 [Artemia franciscana]